MGKGPDMKWVKIGFCAIMTSFLISCTVTARVRCLNWGEQCQPVQRFPYAMSAVVTQIYAS